MALPALSRFPQAAPVRAPKGKTLIFGLRFTTGETSGLNPTLEYDYDGKVSVALTEGTPDLYVITIGSYKRLLSCVASASTDDTVAKTVSNSATNGTVTIAVTANTLANATVDVIILVQAGNS